MYRRTQVTPDQASHLDATIYGLIVLLNMMQGKAHVGVHLYSGGCIHALKLLIEAEYVPFKAEFQQATTEERTLLVDAMQGESEQEKLDMAWGAYARKKLAAMGFDHTWERVYIELDEFEMFLGSMSVYHFGSRYPCFSRTEPIPLDWWHLRLHLYVGNKLRRPEKLVSDRPQLVKAAAKGNVTEEPVGDNTIDLYNPPEYYRGLLAALPFVE